VPAIPEFVLRKLYVPGSLKACEDGFEFQMNNTLAPVTLIGFGIAADEHPCEAQGISLKLPAGDEITAAHITGEQPFPMTVNTLVGIRVRALIPHTKLVIFVDTREAGKLKFSIPLKKIESGTIPGLSLRTRLSRGLQAGVHAWRVRRDPQHPSFHFTPPAHWMNDPNGLISWKGRYHLFYQYNPFEAAWGNIHWGHASSADLLHWKNHPIALHPDPGGADAGGCYSGCAVDDDGVATVIYTGVFPEVQCLARSRSDHLVTWKKHARPIISAPPDGLKVEGFRDPCVWKEDSEWCLAIGSGIQAKGGAVLLYRSKDLIEWQYVGILYQEELPEVAGIQTGRMWECPSFFPLGKKWVLILSVLDSQGPSGTIFYLGDFQGDRFIPDGPPRKLDYGAGSVFYAPQTFLIESGERVMFGWLREMRGTDEMKRAGWSGAISLPRVLTLDEALGLVCTPLAGVATLRGKPEILEKAGQVSSHLFGARMEIMARIQPDTDQWSGVQLASSGVADESVLIGWDSLKSEVVVDCRKARSLLTCLPVEQAGTDEVRLHIFVDGSVLEVFVDDRQAVSARFYIHDPRALRVLLLGKAVAEIWPI
jgi:beta-fructofuranosidase